MNTPRFRTILVLLASFALARSAHLAAQPSDEPTYEIGTIPDQRVWYNPAGSRLAFVVTAPSSLGAAPTLSASWDQANAPDGALAFDAETDRFTFAPAPTDVRPFSVTFLAVGTGAPVLQEVRIEPVQALAPEAAAFGVAPGVPLPDDTANDKYLAVTDRRGTERRAFNELPDTTTREVTVIGRTVILEKGHANGLFEKLHFDAADPDYPNQDIATLTIYADHLILRDALHVPQTRVEIHAIAMDFEDRAGSTTTLSTVPLVPFGSTVPAKNTSATVIPEAEAGHAAGDLALFVRDLAAPGTATRFILHGGTGRQAALGQDGADNQLTVAANPSSYYPSAHNLLAARVKVLEIWQYQPDNATYTTRRGWGTTLPQQYWGADAISPGRPGRGGDGGNARASVAIASRTDVAAGAAGARAPNTVGGAGARIVDTKGTATPNDDSFYTSGVIFSGIYNALSGKTTPESGYPYTVATRAGAGKTAPAALGAGMPGSFDETVAEPACVAPQALRSALVYLRDAYLDGHSAFVEQQLQFYLDVIDEARGLPGWDEVDADTRTDLQYIAGEMHTLLERIRSNLDYFGNPAGWVPMLSFEVNYAAFQQEVDRAFRLLYLNYWVGGIARSIADKRDALRETRRQLLDQIAADRTAYNDAVRAIPGVRVQAEELQQQIDIAVKKIEALEAEALKTARNVVAAKRAARVLGKVAQSFPVGQPALGLAGGAIATSTEIDPNKSFAENAIVVGEGAAQGFATGNASAKAAAAKSEVDAIDTGRPDAPADPATEAALRAANDELLRLMEDTGRTLLANKAADPEIQAEMQRILAEYPVFRALRRELDHLNARKRDFANQIAQLLQSITVLPLGIAHNLRTVGRLNTEIAGESDAIDASTLSYLKDIDGRARARLLKYHYMMARGYAYRRLQPYPGTLNLDDIFKKIVELAGSHGAVIDADSFAELKGVYENQISAVADAILGGANQSASEQSLSVVFPLPAAIIDQLNAGETARFNLKDLDLFPASEENLRLTGLEVTAMDVTPDPAAPAPNAFGIVFRHSGISELQHDGETYLFRHYNESTRSAITWKSVKQFASAGPPVTTMPSAASASLIGALVGKSPSDILIYSRPAVFADLLVSTEVNTPGARVRLNAATVRATYDFTPRSDLIKGLKLVPGANGIAAEIALDTPDRNARMDGRGAFERFFDRNTQVTLTAPARLGEFAFARWDGLPGGSTSPQITITLTDNFQLTPIYEPLVRYSLTVTGGTGSGEYAPGDVVPIQAQPPAGRRFVRWDGPGVADPAAAETTATIADDAAITAVYSAIGGFSALVNISNRALVGTGDDVLIPGFVVRGTGTKRILIRAVGPALGDYGVSGALADPAMTVVTSVNGSNTTVASNDNWGDSADAAAIAATAAAVGAFPLPSDSRDAAVLLDVGPGVYSVVTSGVGETTGIALVEIYDADPDQTAIRLVNISGRARLGLGDQILIPGFVVKGDAPQRFLIRAVGPGLTGYGVDGALADPQMILYKQRTGSAESDPIANNDNWGDAPNAAQVSATAATIGAFPLGAGSADAALLIDLEPGVYTAVASGAGGTTGVALVEVYEVRE